LSANQQVKSRVGTCPLTSRIPPDGKEVDGLATTVHRNGAKAVIATLWKADDAATGQLMLDFYQHWIGPPAITKVQALQHAQFDLLHGTSSAKNNASRRA
jgi:CHAT domain-containing protein